MILKRDEAGCLVVGRGLSWTVVISIFVNFFFIVWFARGIESRVCALEEWVKRNDSAIASLDVLTFRLGKIADKLAVIETSQLKMEGMLINHVATSTPKK